MKVSKRIFLALAIVIVIAIGVAAYSMTSRPSPPKPTVIVVGDAHALETSADPAIGWSDLDAFIQRNCYDTLVEYTEPDLKIVPALATSWTVNPNATEYVFELRKGVTFQDGTPLNASAVKFSIDRSLKMQQLQYYYTSIVKAVEVLGPYEVKITLTYPYAAFLDDLTWTAFSVVNPTTVAEKGDAWLFDHCAGSGRWNMTEYVKGERSVFVANKNHWDPPKIDEVILQAFPDATSMRMALESGTVDAILGDIPPNDVVALENNPKFNVYNGGGSVMVTWSFSSASNVSGTYSTTLRKAIASAIDLEPALKLVFNGTVTPLYSIIPTYFPSYTPVFKTLYPHDVTMAKTYLAQAGFPNGVTIDLTEQSQYPLRIALYEALKQQLADAGITLNIHPMETSAYMDLLYKGGGLLLGNYWGPVYADPDEPLGAIWSTSGSWMGTFYNSSLVDQLYMEQRSTSNQSRRQEIFVKLQQIAAEDLPYIPLYQYSEKLVAKKELKGITDLYVRYPAWWHRVYLEGQTTGQIAPFTPQIVLDVKATDASKLNLNFQYSQK